MSGQNSGSSQIIDENYIQVTKKPDGTAYTDADTDGYIIRKSNNVFLKKILNRPLNITDFGAVGDGITDDSEAMNKALKFVTSKNIRILEFSGNNTYNLNAKSFQLPKNLLLKFSGAILKNGKFIGNNNLISSEAIKIFDNFTLNGSFINTDNVYVEWFGTIPNDSSSVDLKNSLEKLYNVFFSVKLNQGIYYTKIGNIDIKGLTGLSPQLTFVEFDTDNDGQHLFHIGKVGAKPEQRTYDNNFLKSMSLVLISKNKKIHNNSLLIIGASHQVKIDEVKFIANSQNVSLTPIELSTLYKDDVKPTLANYAINFNGGSELISLNNIFTLSDVGVLFTTNTDFVNISNFTSWNGKNGLATTYFYDTTQSNILFSGSQSWSQGLFGVYARSSSNYSNFINVKFENLRIEQLNEDLKSNNKLVASSFWFGDYTYIANLIFSNVMLAGTANGFKFGTIQDGKISLNDILVHYDAKAPRKFAFEAKLKEKGKTEIFMHNVSLAPDIQVSIDNSTLKNTNIFENKFRNDVIVTQ
ncbi:hypothetical protein ACK1KB_00630 [Chryseobacterium sp. TY3]